MLKLYPDLFLKKTSFPVVRITDSVKADAFSLLQTAKVSGAYGVAAPQIGIQLRMIARRMNSASGYEILINPEILTKSKKEVKGREGCLSFPGLVIRVKRAETITFKAQVLDGTILEFEETGLDARIIQHEIDHLDGILLTDHMTTLQKQWNRDHLKRIARYRKKVLKAIQDKKITEILKEAKPKPPWWACFKNYKSKYVEAWKHKKDILGLPYKGKRKTKNVNR